METKKTLGVLLLALALAAGCSAAGDGDTSGKRAADGAADVPRGEPAVADPSKAIKRAVFGGKSGEFELAVVSLDVRGKLADLALSLTTRGGPGSEVAFLYFGYVPEVSLVDPVNLKRYTVVKDSAGNELGTGNIRYNLGQANTLNYTFAAPPENVRSVDVHFGNFPPFRDIPISR
jgi:hypothetical protein